MNHHLRAPCAAVLCAAALATHTTSAQSIYKCTLDGNVSYSDLPCASDAATSSTLAVPVAPAASPAAAFAPQKMNKAAAAIEKERQRAAQREARDAERAAHSAAVQRKRCAKLALTKQWADEDVRHAAAANVEKARLRAKRAGETMLLECPR